MDFNIEYEPKGPNGGRPWVLYTLFAALVVLVVFVIVALMSPAPKPAVMKPIPSSTTRP